MGTVLTFSQFQNDKHNQAMGRLLIFTKDHPPKGEMIHVNIPMAEMLLAVDEKKLHWNLRSACLLLHLDSNFLYDLWCHENQ